MLNRSKTPGAPAFYGWRIVGVLFMAAAIGINMAGPNMAIFVRPMSEDLGFSQATFGWATTARSLSTAFFSPFLGRILDRHGSRGALAIAGLAAGLAVFSLAFVTQGWQMILLFVVLGMVGLQGGNMLYAAVPVANWFRRRRGLAISLTVIGGPVGFTIFVPLTQAIINSYGWEAAFMAIGTIGGLTIACLSILFIRRRPEDLGLRPDGDPQPVGKDAIAAHAALDAEEYPWTRQEAMRTSAFWLLSLIFGLQMFAGAAVSLFRAPYFEDHGFDSQLVAYALATDSAAGIVIALIAGALIMRLKPVAVVVIGVFGFLCLAMSTFLTIFVGDSEAILFSASAFFGLGFPALIVVQNTFWQNFFGRAHAGSIRGAAFPITMAIGAIGAPMAGLIKDSTGSYEIAWWVAFAAFAAGALLMLRLREPRPAMQSVAPAAS